MPKVNYIYCDANVFLAYFNAEQDRINIIDQLFEEVQNDNQRKIVTSVVSITEVSHVAEEKHQNKLNQTIYDALEAFWGDTSLIARQARDLVRQAITMKYALRTNDAIHLVSAQYVGVSEFFTYDYKLKKFGSLVGYDVIEPYVQSPRLPLEFDDDTDK